jgi:hypothetical protein
MLVAASVLEDRTIDWQTMSSAWHENASMDSAMRFASRVFEYGPKVLSVTGGQVPWTSSGPFCGQVSKGRQCIDVVVSLEPEWAYGPAHPLWYAAMKTSSAEALQKCMLETKLGLGLTDGLVMTGQIPSKCA